MAPQDPIVSEQRCMHYYYYYYYYYTPVRVDDGTVQRLHLFYLTSHLRLGPSNLFYHVSLLFFCLCFGPQCLKIS